MTLSPHPLENLSHHKKINIFPTQDIVFHKNIFFENLIQKEKTQNIQWLYQDGDRVLKDQTLCFFSYQDLPFLILKKALYHLGCSSWLATHLFEFKKKSKHLDLIVDIENLTYNEFFLFDNTSYLDEIKKIIHHYQGIPHENIWGPKEQSYHQDLKTDCDLIFKCSNPKDLHKEKSKPIALKYPEMKSFIQNVVPSRSKGFFGDITYENIDLILEEPIQFIIPQRLCHIDHHLFDFSIS